MRHKISYSNRTGLEAPQRSKGKNDNADVIDHKKLEWATMLWSWAIHWTWSDNGIGKKVALYLGTAGRVGGHLSTEAGKVV